MEAVVCIMKHSAKEAAEDVMTSQGPECFAKHFGACAMPCQSMHAPFSNLTSFIKEFNKF